MELKKVERYARIFQVDCFRKEFLKLIDLKLSDNPERNARLVRANEYIVWYENRIDLLDRHGRSCVRKPRFEPLEERDGYFLFSIRNTQSEKNVRIIFIFDDDDNVILLCPFIEHGRADYEKAKEIATGRAKLLGI